MLTRFISVENIGRFDKLLPGPGDLLTNVSVIYGENGSGKTTLSSILAAATVGSAEAIEERRPLRGEPAAKVQLLTKGGMVSFTHGKWSTPLPKLLVFNRDFVHRHVYVGQDIGAEQREALYETAIGAAAVAAKEKLEALTKERSMARAELARVEERLGELAREHRATRERLESMEGITEPPPDLEERRRQLGERRASPGFSSARSFALISPPGRLGNPEWIETLDKTVAALSREAAERVREHIRAHLDREGERWLAKGAEYARDASVCPFCAQPLASSTITSIFPTYFDDAYARLQGSLTTMLSEVERLSAWASGFARRWRENETALAEWRRFELLPDAPGVADLEPEIAAVVEILRAAIRAKQGRPLDPVAAEFDIATRLAQASALAPRIDAYVAWLGEIRQAIERLRANESSVTAQLAASIEIDELRLVRGRADVCDLMTELAQARTRVKHADDAVEAGKLELAAAAQTEPFVQSVNELLTRFGARFRIADFRAKSGARVGADFVIELKSGGTVKASQQRKGSPRFDTVLSDGDRSALGLAIFAAIAFARDDLGECVVVLDDPFTSLDRNRKNRTCDLMNELAQKAAQLLVFSHDAYFLRDLIERCGGHASQRKIAHEDGVALLAIWSAEDECRASYLRDLELVRKFATQGGSSADAEYVWGRLRPMIEEYLRFRFPRWWQPGEWLGTFVERLQPGKEPHRIGLSDRQRAQLDDWKNFSNPPHHATFVQQRERPSDVELQGYAEEIVEFLET